MKRRFLTRIAAASLAVLMLALAGCGGGTTDTQPTDSGTTADAGKVIRTTAVFGNPFDPGCFQPNARGGNR